jgi:uncharacterized membrane protein
MRLPRALLLALVLLAAATAVGVWAWRILPAGAQVAVRFNAQGEADGFMPKTRALAIAPIIGLVVITLLAFAPRFLGGQRELARAGGAFGFVLIGAAAMFLVGEAAVAAHALNPAFDVLRWLFVAIGILLVVVGAVLGRVPPNHLVGVRTPWTLADERVWRRTHYLTGRLMGLAGVALAAVASLGADHADLLAALVICAVGPPILGAIYSRMIASPKADT